MKLNGIREYVTHPTRLIEAIVGRLISIVSRRMFSGPVAEYSADLKSFWSMVSKFERDGCLDFEGICLRRTVVNPDVFFNVVYPWLHRPFGFQRSEIKSLYRRARRIYPSLSFFADNRLHLVQKNGMIAHGVPYFYEGCTIQKGDVVIDIGASPGDFATNCILHGAKFVYAIDEQNDESMQELGKRFGNLTEIVNIRMGSKSKGVGTISIDDFVGERGIRKVSFIKMDIEGGEKDALRGASLTIRKHKPRLAICEYHGFFDHWYLKDTIRSFQCGYRVESLGAVLYAWVPKKAI
jgi:hypothetical protein